MQFRLVAVNCRYTHSCLALYYLRAVLQKNLTACRIDLQQRTINDPYYASLQALLTPPVDGLFFSVYLWNEAYVSRLVEDIRLLLPELPIVVGGPQITYGERKSYHRLVTLVKGEVEGLPAAFFTDLVEKKLSPAYHASCPQHFPYPYRTTDFSASLANRSVYYETSRGCPFSCTYCLSSVEKGMRIKEQDGIETELGHLLAMGTKVVRFVDRTFNFHPARTLKLWDFLAEHGGETVFHFEIAPDRFNESMLSFLRTMQPGRFRFEIGLQSVNPEALAAVRRTVDLTKASEAITALAEMNTVHLHVDLILGLPYETEDSFRHAFNVVFNLQPHYIQMGLLKILPGTELAANKEQFGMLCCRQPPYELLATRWMDRKVLARLYQFGEAVEAVYNNRFFREVLGWMRRHEPDPSEVFMEMAHIFELPEFSGRAKTQELISGVLCRYAERKKEREQLLDLLRYDWLRCGHRFLPDHLQDDKAGWRLRDEASRALPLHLEPYYSQRQRDEFIKRAMFLAPSEKTLEELGFPRESRGVLCFLPEKEAGVLGLQKAVWLGYN